MDAPGIRGDQQQLGHLVGRGFHRRPNADSVAHADRDADAHSHPNADTVANANSDTDPNANANSDTDPNADPDTYPNTFADPDAITHSNGDTDSNADGYSDTLADFDAITFADSDIDSNTFADAYGRRYHAPGWQSRHLLSRLVGAERRDAALSRLRQRGRTATRTRAQYLQRRD
jgi:hypothetical protein